MYFRVEPAPQDSRWCDGYHSGYEGFGDKVFEGIEQGLMNDIQTFSRRTDRITNVARRRVEQFKNSFDSVFAGWLEDVLQAVEQDSRQCLRNKFWNDDPSGLAKECLHKRPFLTIVFNKRSFYTLALGY